MVSPCSGDLFDPGRTRREPLAAVVGEKYVIILMRGKASSAGMLSLSPCPRSWLDSSCV